MRPDSKIYVAGHRGLAGSAILRRLHAGGYNNIVVRPHAELELTDQKSVHEFFERERPEIVFLAAAKVGGILANNASRAEFIYQNLAIQSNVIHAAYQHRVEKLLFLGSSCAYPKIAPQPIREEDLLSGKLESTNEPYAIAKIAGIKMCDAYNRQYGTNFLCAMPTNLYGPGDNYDPQNSHVLPALIRKIHEAKAASAPQVTIWGSGAPRREFMFSDDLANACVFLMERYDAGDVGELVNIGTGKDLTIRDTAELIADVIGFSGDFVFDSKRPEGTPRKLLDVSRMRALGWAASTDLRDGAARSYADFLTRLPRDGRLGAAGEAGR
jgi:GDP-L-fucose synthase